MQPAPVIEETTARRRRAVVAKARFTKQYCADYLLRMACIVLERRPKAIYLSMKYGLIIL
jgi:hypothetical protein